jgi:hypothetical protein
MTSNSTVLTTSFRHRKNLHYTVSHDVNSDLRPGHDNTDQVTYTYIHTYMHTYIHMYWGQSESRNVWLLINSIFKRMERLWDSFLHSCDSWMLLQRAIETVVAQGAHTPTDGSLVAVWFLVSSVFTLQPWLCTKWRLFLVPLKKHSGWHEWQYGGSVRSCLIVFKVEVQH